MLKVSEENRKMAEVKRQNKLAQRIKGDVKEETIVAQNYHTI